MGYWFNSFLGFEEKARRQNRVILSLRYWSPEGSKVATVYVQDAIRLPSRFVHYARERENAAIVRRWQQDPVLAAHPLGVFLSRRDAHSREMLEQQGVRVVDKPGAYNVYHALVPNERSVLKRLGRDFQAGSLNRLLRFQKPWLYRKLAVTPHLGIALSRVDGLTDLNASVAGAVESSVRRAYPPGVERDREEQRTLREVKRFFGAYDTRDSIAQAYDLLRQNRRTHARVRALLERDGQQLLDLEEQIRRSVRVIDRLAKRADPQNQIAFNTDSLEYELTLHSTAGITWLTGPAYNPRAERWERVPLFLSDEEILRQPRWYIDIEKPLWKREEEKISLKRMKRLSRWLQKEEDGGRRERLTSLVARLDARLTTEIGGRVVRLGADEYDARISIFGQAFQRENGERVFVVDKLRHEGFATMNGFEVVEHESERDLMNAVSRRAKRMRPFLCVGHNIPYDVIQSRQAAERARADSYDIAVRGRLPRRDFIRELLQRMVEDLVYVDTCNGYGLGHLPFLPSHKLEAMVNALFGRASFAKGLSYDDLRRLEVFAIQGDREASRKLLDYATRDVPPLIKLVDETPFLRTVLKARNVMPYATLTEVAFSPRSADVFLDKKHFDEAHNLRDFGVQQKVRLDKRSVFKREFPRYWKAKLREAGVLHDGLPAEEDAVQAYVPLELLLRDVLVKRHPEWADYFARLSGDAWERFAELQYPRVLLNNMLLDFYFCHEARERVTSGARMMGAPDVVKQRLAQYAQNVDKDLALEGVRLMQSIDMAYRDILVRLGHRQVRQVRERAESREGRAQLGMFERPFQEWGERFGNVFAHMRKGWVVFADQQDYLRELLPKNGARVVSRFASSMEKLAENVGAVAQSAAAGEESEMNAKDLTALWDHARLWKDEARMFSYAHGILPFSKEKGVVSLEGKIEEALRRVREDVEARGARVIASKQQYVLVTPAPTDFSGSVLIPLGLKETLAKSAGKT